MEIHRLIYRHTAHTLVTGHYKLETHSPTYKWHPQINSQASKSHGHTLRGQTPDMYIVATKAQKHFSGT